MTEAAETPWPDQCGFCRTNAMKADCPAPWRHSVAQAVAVVEPVKPDEGEGCVDCGLPRVTVTRCNVHALEQRVYQLESDRAALTAELAEARRERDEAREALRNCGDYQRGFERVLALHTGNIITESEKP